MSELPSPIPLSSPSARFGQFIGEYVGVLGHIGGQIEGAIWNKIRALSEKNSKVSACVLAVTNHQEAIAKTIFYLGALYNCWRNPLLFVMGTGAGMIASVIKFPIDLPSLRTGELLGNTAKDSFAAPHAMFILALINKYLGATILDDAFFAGSAGLLTGNGLYHHLKETAPGKMIKSVIEIGENWTKPLLIKIPFLGSFFTTEPPVTSYT
jgi:hypothetical protein